MSNNSKANIACAMFLATALGFFCFLFYSAGQYDKRVEECKPKCYPNAVIEPTYNGCLCDLTKVVK